MNDVAKKEAEITRKCFILPIGRDLFKKEIDTISQNQMNFIRSPWTSILVDSFDKTAQVLLHDPVISGHFGKLLVYASQRNFERYVSLGRSFDKKRIHLKMQHCAHNQYGDELLDFAA